MNFLEIPLKNLCRRPLRTVLTVLGIAVGVGSLVALLGMSRGADRAFVLAALERETHIIAMRRGAVDVLGVSCDESLGDRIAQENGVDAVAGELIGILDIEDERSGEMLHMIVTGWPGKSFLWENLELSAGAIPDSPGRDRFGLVLGENWAKSLEKKPGDAVELLGYPGEVAGVTASRGMANRQMGFLLLDDLQRIMREEGKVTSFNIRLRDPGTRDSRNERCGWLESRFPELSFFPSENLAGQSAALGFLRAFTGATSAIALCVALIVTVNTLLMSVTERTSEFAIYSALGWKPTRILSLVLVEGTALSIAGGALGLAAGWLALHRIANLPYLMAIETTFDPVLAASGAVAILALGLGGSLYPAWRASRVQPAAAIGGQ